MLGAILGGLLAGGLGLGSFFADRSARQEQAQREALAEAERNKMNASLNNEWAQNNNAYLNTIIGSQYNREHYGDELKAQMDAYKENGINPNLVYGNTNFGGGTGLAIDSAPQQEADAESKSGLGELKDLLMIMALGSRIGLGGGLKSRK